MRESTGVFSNLKNQKHKHFGWNSCPSVNCVCIALKMEKTNFMSASTLRQSGYGDVREPRRDKAKLTKSALHLQGAAALSPESLRHVMRLKPRVFPTPLQGTFLLTMSTQKLLLRRAALSTALQVPTTQKATWAWLPWSQPLGFYLPIMTF